MLPDYLSDALHEPGDDVHSINDVADALTKLKTLLVTAGNWELVSESAGVNLRIKTMDTPGAGRWLEILVEKISAERLDFTVWDHLGAEIIHRAIDIEGSGSTTVSYYFGNWHLWIVSERLGGRECFVGSLLDVTPDTESSITRMALANAHRNDDGSGGTVDGSFSTVGQFFAIEGAGPAAANSNRIRNAQLGNGSQGLFVSWTGRLMAYPVEAWFLNSGGSIYLRVGMLPMICPVDVDANEGDIKHPAADGSTQLAFKVLPLAALSSTFKLMVRMPSEDL